MKDEWTAVPGTGGMYELTESGVIRSWIRQVPGGKRASEPRLLALTPNRFGYIRVGVSFVDGDGRKIRYRTLHSLMLETFIGPRPAGMIIRHLDGDKLNNRLDNLCYGTYAENAEDTIKHGRTLPGERNPSRRLTREQVDFILTSSLPSRQIAPIVGVTHGHVRKIRRGENWRVTDS